METPERRPEALADAEKSEHGVDALLGEFANAAAYSAAEEPARGVAQIVDDTLGTKLDSTVQQAFDQISVHQPLPAKFGESAWYAQQLGNAGMVVPFMFLKGAIARGVGTNTASEARLAGATGLIDGLFFRPSDSNAVGTSSFWGQRAHRGLSEMASFAALGYTLPRMNSTFVSAAEGLERSGLNAILRAPLQKALSMPLVHGLASGVPVGLINAEIGALSDGRLLASSQELTENVVGATFVGGAFAVGNRVINRSNAEQPATKLSPELERAVGHDSSVSGKITALLDQGMKEKDLERLLADPRRRELALQIIRNDAKPDQLRTVEVDAYGKLRTLLGADSKAFQRVVALQNEGVSLCWDLQMSMRKAPNAGKPVIEQLVESGAPAERFKFANLKPLLEKQEGAAAEAKRLADESQAKQSLTDLYGNDPQITQRLTELQAENVVLATVKQWVDGAPERKAIVENLLRTGASSDLFNGDIGYKLEAARTEQLLAEKTAEARALAPPGKSDWLVLRENGIEITPLDQLQAAPTLVDLPPGKFTPNEMQWRQLKAMDEKSPLRLAYEEKVAQGEAPPLSEIEPKQITQLRELRKEWSLDKDKNSVATISARTLDDHLKLLRAHEDVDKEGFGLNIGAGSWQSEAKEMTERGYKSRAVSIDKRLSLPLHVDLQDILAPERPMIPRVYLSPEEQRVYGRLYPDPMTLAADATTLPIREGSMKWVWGLFSVPFYLKDPAAVRTHLSEANRVLEPGGHARFYPVRADQIDTIKDYFKPSGIIPTIEHTGYYGLGLYMRPRGYLLTWQKPE